MFILDVDPVNLQKTTVVSPVPTKEEISAATIPQDAGAELNELYARLARTDGRDNGRIRLN